MPAPVLQFKRGNAGVAGTVPALRPGEPAISLNNFDFFIGIDTSVTNNKFFGSHRYWKREDATNAAQLRLVDKDGSNYVAIAASDTLAGIATYRLPNTNNGTTGDFLKVKSVAGGFYDLEWAPVPSGSFTIAGDTGSDTFTTGETLTFAGTVNEIETAVTNNQVQIGLPNNVVISGILTVGTGIGITQFSNSISTGTSTSSVPTSSAVIDYVATTIANTDVDDDLSIAGNSGTGTVDLDTQSLTVNGAANQVTTTASGQTITVSLVNDVVVGTSLSVPTIKTGTIQSATGSTSLTIAADGKVSTSSDLTIAGDLYVNGNTTQVNTAELTVYDRTITLGIQTGTTPTTTNWDLGVLMNYGDAGIAKTAGVIWEYGNERFIFAANSDNPASSNTSTPNITVSTYAPIEIASLWINGCGALGALEVIRCDTTQISLQNITVDAGTF